MIKVSGSLLGPVADRKAMLLVQKYLVRIAASVAMDGEAPESEQDAPLREKQYARGTSYAKLDK